MEKTPEIQKPPTNFCLCRWQKVQSSENSIIVIEQLYIISQRASLTSAMGRLGLTSPDIDLAAIADLFWCSGWGDYPDSGLVWHWDISNTDCTLNVYEN